MRTALVAAAMLGTTAAAPATAPAPLPLPVQSPDLIAAGRVLATLDDWRGIMFSQMVIIGVLLLMLIGVVVVLVRLATSRSANDQATLTAVTENTKSMTELAASIRALEAIAARRESERLS